MDDLYIVCLNFREAIEKVKQENGFCNDRYNKDRMYNFPFGCCDDACDLLGYYLKTNFHIDTIQRSYVMISSSYGFEKCRFNHNVLVTTTSKIIDLTMDQLGGEQIYVGPIGDYPFGTDEFRDIPNFDFSNEKRLNDDYKSIVKKLENIVYN